jgi:hypothetical protein
MKLAGCFGLSHAGLPKAHKAHDNSSALGLLSLHQPDGRLRTEKCACEIDTQNLNPLFKREVFQRDTGCVYRRC